jgi:chaperonin GroES
MTIYSVPISFVVVKRIEEQESTRNGIFIPDSVKEKPQQGEVVAVNHRCGRTRVEYSKPPASTGCQTGT